MSTELRTKRRLHRNRGDLPVIGVLRCAGDSPALAFLDRVRLLDEQTKLTVHRVSAEQEDKAWGWLRKHDERAYSFVDATSFQVMRDRRLREALAFDQDFAAAGFLELRP